MHKPVTRNRIVDYLTADGQLHSALVVKVWSNDCVNLAIFDESGGLYSRTSVLPAHEVRSPNDEAGNPVEGGRVVVQASTEPGRWRWPQPQLG